MINRHDVAQKLIDHVQHRLSLDELVAWAEDVMMTGELDEMDFDSLTTIVGRLGLGDVREFGLNWDDITSYLSLLGYQVEVQISKVA